MQNLSHKDDVKDLYVFTVAYSQKRGCLIEMI